MYPLPRICETGKRLEQEKVVIMYNADMEYAEEDLKKWIKRKENKHKIIENLCNDCESVETRSAIFMAGSPGAGKTETARRLIESLFAPYVHVDQDKIKSILPDYSGEMAEKYHGAASIGVDIVFNHILKKRYNFILDSTFSNIKKAYMRLLVKIQKKIQKKSKSDSKNISPAEQATRDFVNMSARDRKKLMKEVIRKASEDQLKVLRSAK